MKSTVMTAVLATLAAAPAFAHGGVHAHPHGIDSAAALVIAACAVLGALAYAKLR